MFDNNYSCSNKSNYSTSVILSRTIKNSLYLSIMLRVKRDRMHFQLFSVFSMFKIDSRFYFICSHFYFFYSVLDPAMNFLSNYLVSCTSQTEVTSLDHNSNIANVVQIWTCYLLCRLNIYTISITFIATCKSADCRHYFEIVVEQNVVWFLKYNIWSYKFFTSF